MDHSIINQSSKCIYEEDMYNNVTPTSTNTPTSSPTPLPKTPEKNNSLAYFHPIYEEWVW